MVASRRRGLDAQARETDEAARVVAVAARLGSSLILRLVASSVRPGWSPTRTTIDDARSKAAANALKAGDDKLAEMIRAFQFRDIRPKAASEIGDLNRASRLLGHTDKRITETVYRRVGEVVDPTR